jgi:hypothetical protein
MPRPRIEYLQTTATIVERLLPLARVTPVDDRRAPAAAATTPCVGKLYPPGVFRIQRFPVGKEPGASSTHRTATVRYFPNNDDLRAYAANLTDDVYEGRFKRRTSNQQLQVRRYFPNTDETCGQV